MSWLAPALVVGLALASLPRWRNALRFHPSHAGLHCGPEATDQRALVLRLRDLLPSRGIVGWVPTVSLIPDPAPHDVERAVRDLVEAQFALAPRILVPVFDHRFVFVASTGGPWPELPDELRGLVPIAEDGPLRLYDLEQPR